MNEQWMAVLWAWVVSFEGNLWICQWYLLLNQVLFLKQSSKFMRKGYSVTLLSEAIKKKDNEIYTKL